MADERVISDIVTKFLLNTCRLRPRLTRHAIQAALTCVQLATKHPPDDAEADLIPLTTGSVAEFYTVSQKKLCHFYFYCNFGKCWSILKILLLLESEGSS